MAVTLTVDELRGALRAGSDADEVADVTRLHAFATEAVVKHVSTAPDVVHNEAAIRVASYLFDQPATARGAAFANALQNSGAASILLPYRQHRAGSVAKATTTATTPAPAGGVTEARVAELIEAHRALPNVHHTPPAQPMPATPAEAAGGTSTTIRAWTAKLVRSAIEAVVPAVFRTGNTDTIPPEKLPAQSGGGGGPEDLGTSSLSIDTKNVFYATGIILPTDKTWLHVSMGVHTETTNGPPLTVATYSPGPWTRVLIQDLIDLPDAVAGGTRNDENAIEDLADVQNFRPLEFGASSTREIMVAVTSLNTTAVIAGTLRLKVS